jgi:hypothetical protein
MTQPEKNAITPVLKQHFEEWDTVLCLRLNQQNPKTHTLEEKICIVGQHRIYCFALWGKISPPLNFHTDTHIHIFILSSFLAWIWCTLSRLGFTEQSKSNKSQHRIQSISKWLQVKEYRSDSASNFLRNVRYGLFETTYLSTISK